MTYSNLPPINRPPKRIDYDASIALSNERARKELEQREAVAAENAKSISPEDKAFLTAFLAETAAVKAAAIAAGKPIPRHRQKIVVARYKGQGELRRLDVRLPERQLKTLRYMAKIEETTLSEQVRPILDAVLRLDDAAGVEVHKRFLTPLTLRRTTLYLTTREVKALKARAGTTSAALRRILDSYLFGE
jgi:hypothetical protein